MVIVPVNFCEFLYMFGVDVSSEASDCRMQHLPIVTTEGTARVPRFTLVHVGSVCIQGQIASTGSFPAQEKGKQPRDYAESEIREITLSLTALDWGQGQK